MSLYARPDDDAVESAYLYLLARALVVRQERKDAAAAGFAYNAIAYNPLGSADFVNPNFDVAYLEAWFAVDDEHAVILEVPEVVGRYHTAQLLDEWGEVIVNINERSTPGKPFGRFALVTPASTATYPDDAAPIVLHSAKAKMLARVELKDDPNGAVALQHAFTASAPADIAVAPQADLPDFDNHALIGVEIFDHVEDLVTSAFDVSPAAASHQIALLARSPPSSPSRPRTVRASVHCCASA